MTELAEDRPKQPKPVSPSWLFACVLEAFIVAAFIINRSSLGMLLCLCYARYSATWALAIRRDE